METNPYDGFDPHAVAIPLTGHPRPKALAPVPVYLSAWLFLPTHPL